jgi:hypothetical protein
MPDISMFDTRTMLAALEQMLAPKSFLLDLFFPAVENSDTEYVDIDIIKGKRRMAPFVNPRMQGKMVERMGYTTRSYKPPYVKPKSVFTAADILKKQPGQHIYQGGQSPAQRAAQVLGSDLMELMEMVTRREEWMASQALNGGVIVVSGDGVEDEIDFGMKAEHIITGDWSDPAVGNPVNDLRTWRRVVAQSSGIVPNAAVMGSDALDAFLAHNEVKGQDALLNARRAEIGQINLSDVQATGATFVGSIFGGGLDLFGYDEWYIDDIDGVEKPMVPESKIFLGSTRARTARHYGAIQDLAAPASVRWFPKSWEEQDPSARLIMLQSAPLVVPHQIDAFAVITVVPGS